MKKLIIALILILMTSPNAQAFYKTEKFMSDFHSAVERDEKGKQDYLLNYLQGIVEGVITSNVLSMFENDKRLFCPPPKITFDSRRVMLLLPNFMVQAQLGETKWKEISGDDPLALIVPQLLIHTYPCN